MWRFTLSTIYLKLNENEKAFNTIDKVIDEFETLQASGELKDDYEETLKICLLGCYMQKVSMVETSNGNIEDEIELLMNSELLTNQISLPNPTYNLDDTIPLMIKYKLAAINESLGNNDEALRYYKETMNIITIGFLQRYPQCREIKEIVTSKIKELDTQR